MAKNRSNTKWIGILLLAVMAIGAYFVFFNDKQKGGSLPEGEMVIPFTKEGELAFVDAQSADTIVLIDIEKAITSQEQEYGLMNRHAMEEKQGMIFISDSEEEKGFWMKNTYISLDIIYVNAQKQIISIAKYAQPLSTRSISSNGLAQYVVEVNGGFCDKFGISKGDKISF